MWWQQATAKSRNFLSLTFPRGKSSIDAGRSHFSHSSSVIATLSPGADRPPNNRGRVVRRPDKGRGCHSLSLPASSIIGAGVSPHFFSRLFRTDFREGDNSYRKTGKVHTEKSEPGIALQ